MRRNLFYELLIVLLCVAVIAVFYFILFGGRLKEVSWAYILLHYKHLVIFPSAYGGREPSAFTLLYLLITSIFTMLFYLLNRWYISRLYGRPIQKLKSLLREMEE